MARSRRSKTPVSSVDAVLGRTVVLARNRVAVPKQIRYRTPAVAALAGVLVLAGMLALASGAIPVSLEDLFHSSANELHRAVLLEIRAPRVLLAGCVGAALALSGAALQGLFRNPLADPGLIGVSSGAALGASVMIVLGGGMAITSVVAPYIVPLAAISGALLVTWFLYVFAARYGQFSIVTIVLVGIATNALAGVGIGVLQYLSDDAGLRTLTFWMMGSFGRATWPTTTPAVFLMLAAAVPILLVARRLDLLQLGEAEALYMGVDVRRLKRGVVLSSAAAVGAGVALVGIVGFVGLVVPHLVRLAIGAGHRHLLPGAALLGATLTILADTLARTAASPAEIPVSLVTSALGAPFFLWLIARERPR